MTDPSSTPEISKPKLTLTPKAAPAPAPSGEAPSASAAPLQPKSSPAVMNEAGGRPPALTSSGNKPSFKLQGPVHAANPDKFEKPAFTSPIPVGVRDSPPLAVVILSLLAAGAALTFAALLYLKTQ